MAVGIGKGGVVAPPAVPFGKGNGAAGSPAEGPGRPLTGREVAGTGWPVPGSSVGANCVVESSVLYADGP